MNRLEKLLGGIVLSSVLGVGVIGATVYKGYTEAREDLTSRFGIDRDTGEIDCWPYSYATFSTPTKDYAKASLLRDLNKKNPYAMGKAMALKDLIDHCDGLNSGGVI